METHGLSRMPDANYFFSEIDSCRLQRARELSEVKIRIASLSVLPRYGVQSKANIVLSYAHWEGFYNECASYYVKALQLEGKRLRDVQWSMALGLLTPDFNRVKDKNHSRAAQLDFVNRLSGIREEGFNSFDPAVIASSSNLNFEKLCCNFRVLGFDTKPFQIYRLRIDKELVGWRHSIAHGNDPDLTTANLNSHVTFAQELLLLMADIFQTEGAKIFI